MSVRVKWLNRNTDYDSITIYRDTKLIDPAALPAKLVELTGDELDYLDTTAPVRTLLYYLIELKKGTEVTYSKPKPTVNIGYNGPGPQAITVGDWRFGYFGTLTTAELFTAAEVCTPLNVNFPASVSGLAWHKFAFNGKVLYFPNAHLSANVGWNYLYLRGLVFGVDGDGPTGHSNTPTNQMKKIAKGDDQFIVRLPRTNNSPGYGQGTADLVSGRDVAEYALINSILKGATGEANPILGDVTLTSINATAPVAEFQGGALAQGCQYAIANSWVISTVSPSNCVRSSNTYLWRPVLEWIMP